MCYNPVSIVNPRIDFRSAVDKVNVLVPCGHCLECQEMKRNEWFVRLYYEWLQYKDKGCVLFPTITYHDDFLPHFNPKDRKFDVLKKYIPDDLPDEKAFSFNDLTEMDSFDKSTVQNFIKKFRTYIKRDFDVDGIKYFVCCEYGETFHRPHYHMFLFLPFKIDADKAKNYIEKSWSIELRKSDPIDVNFTLQAEEYFRTHKDNFFNPSSKWNYTHLAFKDSYGRIHYYRKRGFCSWSEDFGAFVKSVDGVEYITKYVHKPSAYMRQKNVVQFCRFLKWLPDLSTFEKDNFEYSLLETFQNVLPFRLSSKGLGLSLENEFKFSLNGLRHDSAVKQLAENYVYVQDRQYPYRIPQYILNKIMYDTQEVTRTEVLNEYPFRNSVKVVVNTQKRYVTEIGAEVLRKKFELSVKNTTVSFQRFFDTAFLQQLHDTVDNYVDESTGEYIDFKSRFEILIDKIKHFQTVDYRILSLYKVLLNGLSTQEFKTVGKMSTNKHIDFDSLYKTCLELNDYKILTHNDVVSGRTSSVLSDKEFLKDFQKKYPLFDDLPCFEGFNDIILVYNNVRSLIKQIKYIDKEDKKRITDLMRDYFINFKYF